VPELCSEPRLSEQRVHRGAAPTLQRGNLWRLLHRAGSVFTRDRGRHVRCLRGAVRELHGGEQDVQSARLLLRAVAGVQQHDLPDRLLRRDGRLP
jgi:hypothetical protein